MKLSIGTKLIISTITLLIFSVSISLATFYILNKTRNENINIINKSDLISLNSSKLLYHSLEMGNGVRGVLLDPNNESEKRKKIELQLSELANRDFLTKIFNRRKIEEILETLEAKNFRLIGPFIQISLNGFTGTCLVTGLPLPTIW